MIDLESLLHARASSELHELEVFGYAATKKSLEEAIALLKDVVGDAAHSAVAAYGMLLCAKLSEIGSYRDDVLSMLDRLAMAKALIDQSICHTFPTVAVTSEVLLAAQRFADEATIPCTEWPSVEEVQDVVFKACVAYARVDQWRLVTRNAHGATVGVSVVPWPQG